jgi:hypothetical protein
MGLCVTRSGLLAVSDMGNNRVVLVTARGDFVCKIGGRGSGAGQLNAPYGITCSPCTGRLLVCDYDNHRVAVWEDPNKNGGAWVGTIGEGMGTGPGQLTKPVSVAADGAGLVFVGEEGNARVSVFREVSGEFVCWLGGPAVFGKGAYPGLGIDDTTGAIAIYSGVKATAWVQGVMRRTAAAAPAPPRAPASAPRTAAATSINAGVGTAAVTNAAAALTLGTSAAAPAPAHPGTEAPSTAKEATSTANAELTALLNAKAKFVEDKIGAGLRPTPAQIASFLRELVTILGSFAATAPQALTMLKGELQRLGWDVGKNQSTSATPPSAESLLASIRRASANVGGVQQATSAWALR